MKEQNETLLSKEEDMSISDITSDSGNLSATAQAVDGEAITMSCGMNSTSATTTTTEPEEGEAITPPAPSNGSSTTTTETPDDDNTPEGGYDVPSGGENGSSTTTTTDFPNDGDGGPQVTGIEVKVMTEDGTSLSVHSDSSETSPCVGNFADGSVVTLTNDISHNGWYAVYGTTEEGVSINGWCRGNYLAKSVEYGTLVDVPLLNVRADTSTTSEILGVLEWGQSVQILHKNYRYTNNYRWHQILYNDSIGYVVAGNETPNFEFETRWVCLYDGDTSTDGEYIIPEGGTEDSSSTTTTEHPEGEAVTPTPPIDGSSTTTTSYPDNVEDEVEEPRSEDAYHVIVTDSTTGLPIPNATVYSVPIKIQAGAGRFLYTQTDSNGYAQLPSTGDLVILDYSEIGIVVHADGYADWVSESCDLHPSSNEISAKMISRDEYPDYELPLNVSGPSRDSHTDFGWRYLSGIDYHTGIDIGNIGTANKTVKSICDGVIVQNTFADYCGNYITVKSEDGFYVTYMHLAPPEENENNVNDMIKKGEKIGIMSNTNLSSNPLEYQGMPVHLHIMITKTNTVSPDSRDHIDPKAFLTF